MAAQPFDPFGRFKAAQREAWASFLPVEVMTTIPAAKLVKFAQVASGRRVLDVACGTGVVAMTAARRGATVSGLDMFLTQGFAQWEIWMEKHAPEAAMRRAVLAALRRDRPW